MPAARLGTSLRLFWRIHRAFVRLTGGRFGRVGALPVLLLTTRGRKSGERRDVALNYIRDDDAFVVIGSYVGEDRDPAWWLNLKAHPDAEILVDGKRFRVRARQCDGAKRQLLWDRIVSRDRAYEEYQRRTKRRLPVVALEPIR
jgi:deazaflavin-dependent oxidoreductase (nitroreductase family)